MNNEYLKLKDVFGTVWVPADKILYAREVPGMAGTTAVRLINSEELRVEGTPDEILYPKREEKINAYH